MAVPGNKSLPPFIAFTKEKRAEVKEANPSLNFSELQQTLSSMWHNLSEEDKQKYRNQPNENAKSPTIEKTPPISPFQVTTRIPFPKIAPSPFSYFMSQKREEVQSSHPLLSRSEITSILHELWSKLTKEQKEEYEQFSAKDMTRYRQEWSTFVEKNPTMMLDDDDSDEGEYSPSDDEDEEEMEDEEDDYSDDENEDMD